MRAFNNKYRGFTLVEMAIVLVILGLVLSAVMSMGNALVSQSRISATKTKEEAIKTALISYIARNNRMPCPAVPNIAPSTPLVPAVGYGVEAVTAGTCTGVPDNGGAGAARVVMGIVPWITLGLSDDAGQDGYYNRFSYAVTSNATNLDRDRISGMVGNITTHDFSPIVLGLPAAGNQSNDCSAGAVYNPCSIVAVIISHGANANGAYAKSGNQVPLPLGADELENTDINSAFVQKDFADGANAFDDILLTLNASDLLSPLTLNGSLKDYNAALQNNFKVITGAATNLAAIARTGASPNQIYHLPLNVAALNLPAVNTTDPWGNPINYQVTTADIDSLTVDAVAFTMTSLGQDGIVSADDIFSRVRVSELQSKFTIYGW